MEKTLVEIALDTTSIKTLSNCFHYLQKIGREVIIEFGRSSLILRAVNDYKSAFSVISLSSSFFDSVHLCPSLEENDCVICKISLKSLCPLFRSSKLAKSLALRVSRHGADHLLSFEFLLQNGVVRKHDMNYEESDVMNAVFEEDSMCSKIRVRPAVMLQLLEHFRQRSSEILLKLNCQKISMTSYYSTENYLLQSNVAHNTSSSSGLNSSKERRQTGRKPIMNTDVSVRVQELETIIFGEDSRVQQQDEVLLLSAKEMIAFIAFSELNEFSVCEICCSMGGRPLRLSGGQEQMIVASLVIATAEGDEVFQEEAGKEEQKEESVVQQREGYPIEGPRTIESNRDGLLNPSLVSTFLPIDQKEKSSVQKKKKTNHRKIWLESSSDEG